MPKKKKRVAKKRKKASLESIEKKLDLVLKKEKEQLREGEEFEKLEKKQLKELSDLEKLEKSIKKQVSPHPLRSLTIKDMSKALIGAFVGIISHFAFAEGAHLAESITMGRASLFFLVSFLIGLIFIYFTGYRKVIYRKLLFFLPVRLTVIYIVTIFTVFFVLYLFNFTIGADFSLIYKQVAVVSLPAIIGASAADLIGRE